jgi:hypothetical protein
MSLILDTRGFTAACSALAHMAGGEFKNGRAVVKSQTAAVLKACMQRTNAATAQKIKAKFSKSGNVVFDSGEVIAVWRRGNGSVMFLEPSNYEPPKGRKRVTGRAGPPQRAPKLVKGNMTWHDMSARRWSNERWARFQSFSAMAEDQKKATLAMVKKAGGLTKKSWADIAQSLGLNIGAPGYVLSAKPARSKGRPYIPSKGAETADADSFSITISNFTPILVKKFGSPSGMMILQGAIGARAGAFNREMKLGVFDDLAARARRYPAIFGT